MEIVRELRAIRGTAAAVVLEIKKKNASLIREELSAFGLPLRSYFELEKRDLILFHAAVNQLRNGRKNVNSRTGLERRKAHTDINNARKSMLFLLRNSKLRRAV